MEEVRIKYKYEVINFLNQLVFILFQKDYFSSYNSSVTYKNKIIDFIDENISTFPSRKTPLQLKNFGSYYIFYKSTQRTTWYIFFEKEGNNFLVTGIINNNSKEVKWL